MKGSDLLSFVEQAPVAVAMFDREMRYVAVSRRWLGERGLDPSVIGRTAYEVYPDVDAKFRDLHRRALAGETIAREEDQFEVAHGGVHWVRSEMRPWFDAEGEIGGIVIFAEDITARKQAEDLLRKSEERFRYAMDAARDGIWDWDIRTGHVAYSPAYRQMLGYDAAEWEIDVLGWVVDRLHPDDRDAVLASAHELLASPGRYELEFRLRARDGSYRHILSRGKTVERDAAGAPVRAVGTHTDITERKAIEARLRQREEEVVKQHEELEAIYQNAPIGLASLDTTLRYRRINQRLAEICGLPQEAFIGRTVSDVVPAMGPLIEEAAKAVLAGKRFTTERELSGEMPTQPGVERHFRDHWYPVFGKDGAISGCGVVVDEITERKKIELRLQQASERLELAQSAASIGIWEWDLLSGDSFINDQWRLIFGLPGDAALTYDDFVARLHPDDREAYEQMMQRAFAGGGVIDQEMRIIRADNRVLRWIVSKGRILFDDAGRPVRATGAVWDITPFKEAQEALLRRSEDRYRRIVETAQEGIWLLDEEARTSFVNPKMARILGYAPKEMIGRPLLDFMDEEWRNVASRKLVDRASGIVETHDFKFRRKDGSEIWALLSCAPILEGDVYKGALAMVADFTERRKLEEERKLHLQELKQVDRRKDEFLATVGHELRTPLATIKLAVDMLEKDAGLNQKSHDLLARIQRQVKHLTRMVEDILQVSRLTLQKTHLEREEFDLAELVAQTVDAHKIRFAEKGVRLNVAGAEETLPVTADVVRLSQVFGNLLDNAVKFTDRNGQVDVVVSRDGDEAVVTIRDTGVGVAPERLTWIFELFNQMRNGTDRVREGIGVGLALARKFVELHGGSIEAKSEGVGKGAAFVVRLPLIVELADQIMVERR